jgi:vancomycin resistance protein VanJ
VDWKLNQAVAEIITSWRHQGSRRIVGVCAWAALACSLGTWLLLRLAADEYWLGTLLAFGPRWALLLPVGVALLVAVGSKLKVQSSKSGKDGRQGTGSESGRPSPNGSGEGRKGTRSVPTTLLLLVTGLVVLGPVMGFCVPWRTWGRSGETGVRIKILTCNTLGGRADGRFDALIEREQPDVVVLQEWPSERPVREVLAEGREIARAGGILVASRLPIVTSEPLYSPARSWPVIGLRCELLMAGGPVQLFGLHLLSPRKGLEAVLEKGLTGLEELNEVTEERQIDGMAVEAWLDKYAGPKMVAGDMNMTPESMIYRRRCGHLQNAFSTAGWGFGGTKFTRIHSVRIDHVLTDKSWRITRCEVGPDVGSDHRPVVAEMVRQ